MRQLACLAPAFAALTLSTPTAAAYEVRAVEDGGRIVGVVKFRGTPPAHAAIPGVRDGEPCRDEARDESLVIGQGGGLGNVAVFLDRIDSGKPIASDRKPLLDNVGCGFRPHVQVMAVGQVLEVRNSDPVVHRVHAFLNGDESLFTQDLPIQNQSFLQKMKREGTVFIRCDSGHPWAAAYVVVRDHPYATLTTGDGSFTLDQVPPGAYTLRSWHEVLGEQRFEIQVKARADTRLEIVYPTR